MRRRVTKAGSGHIETDGFNKLAKIGISRPDDSHLCPLCSVRYRTRYRGPSQEVDRRLVVDTARKAYDSCLPIT